MKLPTARPAYDPQNEAQARRAIELADALNLKVNRASDRILLRAPNGSIWSVSVSNAGVLVVSAP